MSALERLTKAIAAAGRSEPDVLRAAGLAENCIRNARARGNEPSAMVIAGVCREIGVTTDEIMLGKKPAAKSESGPMQMLPLYAIRPMGDNPRQEFDLEKLDGIAASIEQKGLLTPILVRPLAASERIKEMPAVAYAVIAGERRWRALNMLAQRGKWDGKAPKVPCLIQKPKGADILERALIENLQRENMHPLDEGEAFLKLAKQFGRTPPQMAHALGISVRYIQQRMKAVRDLIPAAKDALREGNLDFTRARALSETTREIQEALLPEMARFRTGADLERTIANMEAAGDLAADPVQQYKQIEERAAEPSAVEVSPRHKARMARENTEAAAAPAGAEAAEEEEETFDEDEAGAPQTPEEHARMAQRDMTSETRDWIANQIHGMRRNAAGTLNKNMRAYWEAKAKAAQDLIAILPRWKKET